MLATALSQCAISGGRARCEYDGEALGWSVLVRAARVSTTATTLRVDAK
jgi:hypothetical protein